MSRYEKYEMKTIKRSEIQGAGYNPRSMSNQARSRLKRGIEKHGLVQPIIVNERTGHVVGGHQRLGILDDLEGRADYELQVAVVSLSDADEKRINVLLNNDGAQGHWDETKLLALLAEEETLDFDALGFSSAQGEYYEKLLTAAERQDDEIMRAMMDANDLHLDVEETDRKDVEARHTKKLDRKAAFEEQVSTLMMPQDNSSWKLKTDEDKKAYNNARENYKKEDFEFASLRITFKNNESKKAFLTRHGLPFKDTVHESELEQHAAELAGSDDYEEHQAHDAEA